MKRIFQYSFATSLVVCVLSVHANGLNWPKLELALGDAPGPAFATESFLLILENEQPGGQTNTALLTEMSVQSHYPFVAITGLAGLIKIDREQAYRVSLHHVWDCTNITSSVLLPFLFCLTNKLEPEAFRSAFSGVALSEPRQSGSAAIAIGLMPLESLIDWLFSAERKKSSITTVALVVERIWNNRDQLSGSRVREVEIRLKELKRYPGMPTAVYLLHCDDDSFPLVSSIEALANDETVEVLLKQMLFRKYAKKLEGHLNIDGLIVSPKEKTRYKSWLLMYSKETDAKGLTNNEAGPHKGAE